MGSNKIFKNGFPRPPGTLSNRNNGKVLVIPLEFNNLPFTTISSPRQIDGKSDFQNLQSVIIETKKAFKELSAGRFNIEIDVLPESQWWQVDSNYPFVNQPQVSNITKLIGIANQVAPDFSYEQYDSYVFLSGDGEIGQKGLEGLGGAEAGFNYTMNSSKNISANIILMNGKVNRPYIWVHELNHSLFAFEDLYLFSGQTIKDSFQGANTPDRWDLMSNAARQELLMWNKLLMGWVQDSEVRCVSDQRSTTHYLAEFGETSDPSVTLVNVAPGVTLAAEVRPDYGSDKGLLVYLVDSHIPHGAGPILARESLLRSGASASIYDRKFTVLDVNSEGVLFEITQTGRINLYLRLLNPLRLINSLIRQ